VIQGPVHRELMPLRLMRRGEVAEIGQLIGQREQVHRLEELGLRAGVAVEMVQPGTPCIVRIGRERLCFRDNETLNVLVYTGVSN
jgi:ferrous iron transport protein A